MQIIDYLISHLEKSVCPVFVFDYDGTLAKHHDEPSQALLSAEQLSVLSSLAALLPVAILSGRPRHELMSFLPIEGITLIGEYGLDNAASRGGRATSELAVDFALIEQTAQLAAMQLSLRISRFERKLFTANIEVQEVNTQEELVALRDRILHIQPNLYVRVGHRGLDASSRRLPSKQEAISRLIRHLNADFALYAGDDLPDEEVFEWLADVKPSFAHVSIRVGRLASQTRAAYQVYTPEALFECLASVISLVQSRAGGTPYADLCKPA